jgi:hypothetical protein
MRIDLLLAREAFPDVFSQTIGAYLRQRFGWSGQIQWRFGRRYGSETMLVNEKLNVIFPSSVQTSQMRGLAAEYSYHPNPVRRVLQTLYTRYAVARPLRRALSCATILIDPWPAALQDCCILAGNHSIRIVDFARDECVVICKQGFRKNYLYASIALRMQYPDLPSPRVLDANIAEGWYREKRVFALPLNRVADGRRVERALTDAHMAMARLYDQTKQDIPTCDWLASKLEDIRQALEQLPFIYGQDVHERVMGIANSLANAMHRLTTTNSKMPIAMTHGDFQPANILIPNGIASDSVYLIDWEYSAARCRWYDALVHELRSRFPRGLAHRVRNWIRNGSVPGSLFWCCAASTNQFTSEEIAASFLLEDLLFRIADTTIPGLLCQSTGYLSFLDEVEQLKFGIS